MNAGACAHAAVAAASKASTGLYSVVPLLDEGSFSHPFEVSIRLGCVVKVTAHVNVIR